MRSPSFAWLSIAAVLTACSTGDTTSTTTGSTTSASTGATTSTTTSGATTSGTTSSGTSSSSSTGTGGGGGMPSLGTPVAYVGSGDGTIRVMHVDLATGALTPDQDITQGLQNPSFLAFSPNGENLYAVDEGKNQVDAFSIDGANGHIAFLNSAAVGAGPAHVAVDKTGAYVASVAYTAGSVSIVPIHADGSLGTPAAPFATGANAHEIVFDDTGHFAFVPNKGSDNVSQLMFDPATGVLSKNTPATVSIGAGSGPRHFVKHPSLSYAWVIRENDDKISGFFYDPMGKLGTKIEEVSTLDAGTNAANNTCAEIAVGKDGQYLYASNRGEDTIVVFKIDSSSGKLAVVGRTPTGGMTPRHFSIDPTGKMLFVGNQNSSTINAFFIDDATGLLTAGAQTTNVGAVEFVTVRYLK